MPNEWQKQLCPVLTIGLLKPAPEASPLVTASGAPAKPQGSFEVFPCHGPQCAWFMPIANEKGQVLDGKCALPLATAALGNLVQLGVAALGPALGAVDPSKVQQQPSNTNGAPAAPGAPVIPNKS